jgi:hypothetical protein
MVAIQALAFTISVLFVSSSFPMLEATFTLLKKCFLAKLMGPTFRSLNKLTVVRYFGLEGGSATSWAAGLLSDYHIPAA